MVNARREWALAFIGLIIGAAIWLLGRTSTTNAVIPEPLPQWSLAETKFDAPPATEWIALNEDAFTRHGTAFGSGWAKGSRPGQSGVSGFTSGLHNSFHGGDDATGWLVSVPFTSAHLVRGHVGGGSDCTKLFVGVLMNGAVSQRVCGENSETLREFTMAVPAGAQLVIADFARGGWAHLLVSDLSVSN